MLYFPNIKFIWLIFSFSIFNPHTCKIRFPFKYILITSVGIINEHII